MKKAMVAMSGGVDSSVAAYLIKQDGFDAIGVTLKLFSNDDIGVEKSRSCCSLDDVSDARSVAFKFGMPFYVFNYSKDFKEKVIKKFVDSYIAGCTPNPCIDCNRFIKFSRMLALAEKLGFSHIVTGHYAIIEYNAKLGRYLLKKSTNEEKDQSYVLYSLTQHQLARTLFPLGRLSKDKVREIAAENGFANANKPDSQDICFVKDNKYLSFIEEYIGAKLPHGNFVHKSGKILGKHKGLAGYTTGQRRGLGVSYSEPLYVLGKNIKENSVILGSNADLFSAKMIITDMNFISIETLSEPMKLKAKIRYRHKEQPCIISPLADGRVLLEFDEAQRAPTTGQAAVFYDDDIVVGGGTITEIL